jgi:hypothetical protein
MSNKTIFPPLSNFPAIPQEDLRILLDVSPAIVDAFNVDRIVNALDDVELQHATMAKYLRRAMPGHALNDAFREEVVPWLFQCKTFWSYPRYVQKLEIEKVELIRELTKYREYITWQKQHLQSAKFHTNTTIQVADLLHAMEQAGI